MEDFLEKFRKERLKTKTIVDGPFIMTIVYYERNFEDEISELKKIMNDLISQEKDEDVKKIKKMIKKLKKGEIMRLEDIKNKFIEEEEYEKAAQIRDAILEIQNDVD